MVSLVALGNLILQIAILIIIIMGLFLKREHELLLHGSAMLVAVILNFLSFLLVMGPSLLDFEPVLVAQPAVLLSITTFFHASLGSIAEILGDPRCSVVASE
jgi:hypothetical protein